MANYVYLIKDGVPQCTTQFINSLGTGSASLQSGKLVLKSDVNKNNYTGTYILNLNLDFSKISKVYIDYEFFSNLYYKTVGGGLKINTITAPLLNTVDTSSRTTVAIPITSTITDALALYTSRNYGSNVGEYTQLTVYNVYYENKNTNKYLIKQFGAYYSIKPEYYDITNNFIPLQLSGGTIPNTQDIQTYGFDDINMVSSNMTINNETFKPVDKLLSNFQVKLYRPK